MQRTSRRSFLHTTAATVAGAWAARAAGAPGIARAAAAPAGGTPKKAVLVSMLPKELSMVDRFKLAREVGFEATEVHTVDRSETGRGDARRAEASGLKIHSVMNEAHWQFPLSSADPEVVRKSVAGMETSLRNAALFKAGTVLLVPAVVDAKTSYADAWKRSQQVIRERILPLAAELKVIVARRGGLEQVPPEPARVRALRRRVPLALGQGLLRRGQRRLLRLPAGLDPHPRPAHRRACT